MSEFHRPVMVAELLEVLAILPGQVVVDATVGGGGHAEAVLEAMEGRGKLIGIDCDLEAIAAARTRLSRFGNAVSLIHGKFSELDTLLDRVRIQKADRIYFDLGVSSHQLEKPERGFSFLRDAPLDMRMDQTRGETAAELLNRLSETELSEIFFRYGEERHGRRVAREIVRRRKKGEDLGRTRVLAKLAEAVVGRRGARVHPATRIFQALRIAVNHELEELLESLGSSLARLASAGRMAVISYHSLEDRMVKNFFREKHAAGALKILTKKPIRPSQEEIKSNIRSRSAKLRGAEKV